jgi:hypothetical protein
MERIDEKAKEEVEVRRMVKNGLNNLRIIRALM